jgi:N-carbamoyl-L-amino-acid hydrolase
VHNVQGISWQALTITGQSNHAGTTPMRLRHDAGYCAAAIATFVRRLADEMGGSQVATVGALTLHPNLINVIAARAELTVDLRNTDEALLQQAEARVAAFIQELAADGGRAHRSTVAGALCAGALRRRVAARITGQAQRLGYDTRVMTSGAGHDAQMMARLCPTAMIFVPSVKGISHNPAEHTASEHLVAGANVLLHTLLDLAA